MDDASRETLSKNIEDKLDEFFGENGEQQLPAGQLTDHAAGPGLEKLKSMVLSIDWEITDECLTGLITETDALISVFQDDRPTNALLRMLKALANYIRKHKVQAHQGAIKRIMSVYSSLESIVQKYADDDNQKRKIVSAEIQAFNGLKDQIGAKREMQKTAAVPAGGRVVEDTKQIRDVKNALSVLEAQMNSQIEQLKKQLTLIKMELSNFNEN